MALQTLGRAKSLAFTIVGSGGPTSPIGGAKIQGYEFTPGDELATFMRGNSRVESHYQGKKTASIKVTLSDLAAYAAFGIGQKYSNVILTCDSAIDSAGVDEGDDATITLSKAVVTELGALANGNESDAPITYDVTFQLSRHAGDSADPTFTIAVTGG